MKNVLVFLAILVFAIPAEILADEATREQSAKQMELDAACEVARQKHISIARAKEVDRCVAEQERPDRAACDELYYYYGEQSGNRPALFYDLPECKRANEFRNSY